MPGISPRSANSRKQIRQMPNFLIKPRRRPQRQQRLITRLLNFGFLFALAINAFVAIILLGNLMISVVLRLVRRSLRL